MATESEHLQQFQHNLAVAGRLFESADWDWGVTVLFYAAMHLVQAYFVREGLSVRTHAQRERNMLGSLDLAPIVGFYKRLRDASENARYECRRFSRQEAELIRRTSFDAVSRHLRSLLGVA